MPHRLLIILFSWLATMGSLFLMSSPPKPTPSQAASIFNQPIASPLTPAKTALPRTIIKTVAPLLSSTPSSSPVQSYASTPSNSSFYLIPSPTPRSSPTPASQNTPAPTSPPPPLDEPTPTAIIPSPSPSLTPSPSFTPTPTLLSPVSGQHLFYTSSHWKAKYYYCDTDKDWQNLSPTYLKSFSSEQELLAAYSRISHEPCKN